ncbi:MAG: YbhB/YbcL family Raf kinase inhibitor-like protein [Candidatus Lokiarchaeota archaeon]|nr:YbhB/YbcL family Raf kinase inhibitor-like protein [Candidatus Lokiarchaeota archaeon]
MKLEAPDLADKSGFMKKEYTVDGADVSPELTWSDVPAGTKSFALWVHDPDAPDPKKPLRDWKHWIIVNIPATARKIPKGGTIGEEIPNDGGGKEYGGPSPPIGVHRYFFKLYALNVDKLAGVTKDTFMKKVEPYKIAEAEIMAKYGRK